MLSSSLPGALGIVRYGSKADISTAEPTSTGLTSAIGQKQSLPLLGGRAFGHPVATRKKRGWQFA